MCRQMVCGSAVVHYTRGSMMPSTVMSRLRKLSGVLAKSK